MDYRAIQVPMDSYDKIKRLTELNGKRMGKFVAELIEAEYDKNRGMIDKLMEMRDAVNIQTGTQNAVYSNNQSSAAEQET